mmetsp:Transcript_9240/g.20048  ORF Transcript_9240/g.20048 Transcript_9240/m.20048 type:complete len:220 (-) Transcript_9240:432-1091(-)
MQSLRGCCPDHHGRFVRQGLRQDPGRIGGFRLRRRGRRSNQLRGSLQPFGLFGHQTGNRRACHANQFLFRGVSGQGCCSDHDPERQRWEDYLDQFGAGTHGDSVENLVRGLQVCRPGLLRGPTGRGGLVGRDGSLCQPGVHSDQSIDERGYGRRESLRRNGHRYRQRGRPTRGGRRDSGSIDHQRTGRLCGGGNGFRQGCYLVAGLGSGALAKTVGSAI